MRGLDGGAGATSGAGTGCAAPRKRWSGTRATPAGPSASSTRARTSTAPRRRRQRRPPPPAPAPPTSTSWARSTSAGLGRSDPGTLDVRERWDGEEIPAAAAWIWSVLLLHPSLSQCTGRLRQVAGAVSAAVAIRWRCRLTPCAGAM